MREPIVQCGGVGALPHTEYHYLPGEGHLSLVIRHIGAVLAGLHA